MKTQEVNDHHGFLHICINDLKLNYETVLSFVYVCVLALASHLSMYWKSITNGMFNTWNMSIAKAHQNRKCS